MNPYMNNNQNSVYPMRQGQYIPWDLTVFRNISIAGTCASAYISYIKTTVGQLYCVLSCVGMGNTRTDVIIDMKAGDTQIQHIDGITIVVSTGGIGSQYQGSGSWQIDPTCIGQAPPNTGYMYVALDGAKFSTHAVLQLQVADSAYYQVDGSSFIVRYKGSRPATQLRIDYAAQFNGVLSINGVSGSRLDIQAVYPVTLSQTARGSFIYVTINCAQSAEGNRLGCNSKVPV